MSAPAPAAGEGASSSSDGQGATAAQTNTMRLQVKTLKGDTFAINMAPESTVASLQSAIEAQQGVPVSSQRLIFKGRVLKPEQTLASHAMEEGDCLHLIVKSAEPTPPAAADGGAAAAAGQPSSQQQVPVLSPNNALPGVPPPAFGFLGPPQVVQLGGVGGGGAMPLDLGALLGGLFGGLHPAQPAQQAPPQPAEPEPAADAGPPVHRGITCDGCGTSPVTGVRYHCQNCSMPGGFDLCEACENAGFTNAVHTSAHTMLKMRRPVPPAAVLHIPMHAPFANPQAFMQGMQQNVGNAAAQMQAQMQAQAQAQAAASAQAQQQQQQQQAQAANQAAQAQQASRPQSSPSVSMSSPVSPAAAAGGPASPASAPAAAAAAAPAAAAGVPLSIPGAHPLSHPSLSVNAVRSFLTEVAQNVPRLSSAPPLSLHPGATLSQAAVQEGAFSEDLRGVLQLLEQTRAVLSQVNPPMLHRLHERLADVVRPIAPSSSSASRGDDDSGAPARDSPAQRLALQQQVRSMAFGLRRTGDSLRGLATLLEAIQVNPQTGDVSLLILPPHLQAGLQMSVAQGGAVPPPGVGGAGVASVQLPGMPPGAQLHIQGLPPGAQFQVHVQHHGPSPPPPSAASPQQQQQQQRPPSAAQPAPSPSAASRPPPAAAAPPANAAPPAQPQQQQSQAPSHRQENAAPEGQAPQPQQQQQPQQPPNPLAGIMSALGPMFAQLQVPAQPQRAAQQQQQPQGAPPSVAQPAAAPGGAGAPNFANLLNQMMPMVSGMLQNAGVAAGGGGGAAGGGGNLQDLMQNMLGQFGMGGALGGGGGGGAGMGAGAGGPASPAAVQRAANQMGGRNQQNPENQREGVHGPDDQEEGAGNANRAERMIDDEEHEHEEDGEEEHASLFDLLLSQMMTHLQLPDLIGLVSGNFAGLERVHAPFRELLRDMLGGDESEASRELLGHSFTASVVDSIDEQALASVQAQRIQNGPDPRRVSIPVVKKHVRALLDLILDTPVVAAGAPVGPGSFSTKLKEWSSAFVGEWLVELAACFHDGLTSSQKLATALLQNKLSSMGGAGGGLGDMAFLMPMLTSSLGGVMMKCAQQYQQAKMMRSSAAGGSAGGGQAWLELVPEEHRVRWARTIAADEAVMEQQLAERRSQAAGSSSSAATLYVPLSGAYRSGGGAKRKDPAAAAAAGSGASAAAAASGASSSSSSAGAAAAAPVSEDRRIAEQLERQLGRSLSHALSTAGAGAGASSGGPGVEQTVALLPASVQDAYREQLTADLRTLVSSPQFAADYSAQRFPDLEQHVMRAPKEEEEKKL